MILRIYEFTRQEINEHDATSFDFDALNSEAVYWYQVQIDKRQELVQLPTGLQFDAPIPRWLQEPSEHTRVRKRGDLIYGELAIHSEHEQRDVEYLGIVASASVLITIGPKQDAVFKEVLEEYLFYDPDQRVNISHLFYLVVNEFISAHADVAMRYRKEVELLADKVDAGPDATEPAEIMDLKSKISDLVNVLEQQFLTLSFAPRTDYREESQPYREAFSDLLKALEILKNSLLYTEQRLNSVHDHYLLLIQEKSNQRINFLTIVQAVFVPLTLLAGLYGMNFSFMPELEWRYSYFVLLAIMALLVIVEIRYFYKHGWFDNPEH